MFLTELLITARPSGSEAMWKKLKSVWIFFLLSPKQNELFNEKKPVVLRRSGALSQLFDQFRDENSKKVPFFCLLYFGQVVLDTLTLTVDN